MGGIVENMCRVVLSASRSWSRRKILALMTINHMKPRDVKVIGELVSVCAQIVITCLYLASSGRPDVLWTVNVLARAVTTWTRACDKILTMLISYVWFTRDHR